MTPLLSITSDNPQEVPARSKLPWVWFGFFFVAAFFIAETLIIVLELDETTSTIVLVLIGLAGWIYWLFCVHRFHKVLGQISRNHYPISGAEAAGKHFIPFYNLYWVFRWPTEMSDYLNRRGRVKMISGKLLGLILLISMFTARFFDGGLGLTGMFGTGMYIYFKLRRHLELIGQADRLPPPPDPNWFGTPAEPTTNKVANQ